jgi:iron complex outermembrane recepter protein
MRTRLFSKLPRRFIALAVIGATAPGLAVTASDVRSDARDHVPQIVVTATPMESPLAVVMDPRQPRQPIPAHDGADYLKTVAGFSVIRKGGTDGDALFRGMAASRVNILADDSPLFGGCGNRMDPPTAYIFPQSYDVVRILKGPQAVRYGPGASAATVIFERADYDPAQATHALSGGITAGSWGRRDAVLDGTLGSGAAFVRLQGSDSRADDYSDGDGNVVHSRYHRWNANATAGWMPGPATLVELSAGRSDGEAAYADRGMDGTRFARDTYALRIRQEYLSPVVTGVEGRFSYNAVDHVMDNYSLRTLAPSGPMATPRASNPDRRTVAGRLEAALAVGGADLVIGTDFQDDRHRVRATSDQTLVRWQDLARVADAAFRQTGAFAELTYAHDDATTWIAGLRADRIRAEDKRETIPAGMTRQPNATAGGFLRVERQLTYAALPDTTIFAGLGHSQRPADYWERIGGNKVGSASNSAFFTDPERTTQLDVGAIVTGAEYRVAASLFHSEIDDFVLVDTRAAGVPVGTAVVRNVDARTSGGELELSRRFRGRWQAEGTLAYVRGTNRSDGVPLAQMPPLEARLGLTYTGDRFSAGSLLRLVAAQDRVDPGRGNIVGQDIGESAGFGILSLNASYRPMPTLTIAAGVDNLFDRHYVEHLSRAGAAVAGFAQIGRIPEPGRTLWLTLDLRL